MCRETAKYQTYCNDVLQIKIYCIAFAIGRLKIVINTKGKEQIGEKIYRNPPTANDENWSDVIRNLYKRYYELNYKVELKKVA